MIIVKGSEKTVLSNTDIERFESVEFQKEREKLARHAVAILTKTYPGYLWCAQCVGYGTIALNEARLLEWGGDVQGYKIHDVHWSTMLEFETIVKKFGGELLERCSLVRSTTASQASKYGVEKLPDGFSERFVRNRKLRKYKVGGMNPFLKEALAREQQKSSVIIKV